MEATPTRHHALNEICVAAARPLVAGFIVAVSYVVIVATLYTLIANLSTPGDVGYQWIPFIKFIAPWAPNEIAQDVLIPAFLTNIVVLFLLGTVFELFRRSLFRSK